MKTKTLFLTIFSLAFACQALAQSDTVKLGEILINSTRGGTEASESPRTVYNYKVSDYIPMPVNSIEDILETSSSTDIRTRGTGSQSDISIRGGSFEQTLVMLNGIPMTDPQTGHHTLNIPVSILGMERIVTYPGGASGLFGPKAFSGAVNYVQKPVSKNQIILSSHAGDYNWRQTDLYGSLRKNNLSAFASGGYTGTDGYIKNTDLNSYHFNGGLNYIFGSSEISVTAGHLNKEFGAQNFYTANFPDQYEHIQTSLFTTQYHYNNKNIAVLASAYFRQFNDKFELFREDPSFYTYTNGQYISLTDTAPSWYSGHNYHLTNVYGGSTSATFTHNIHKLTIGSEYRFEQVWSNVLGESLNEPVSVKGEKGINYTKGTDRNEFSVFAEESVSIKRWILTAGVNATFHSVYNERISPVASVSYAVSDKYTLFANFGTSFRYPTFTDLYYNLGGAVGSIDLKPESATNYELGMRAQFNGFNSQLSFYRRETKNLIDWIRYNGSSTTQAANITEATFNGIDFNMSYMFPAMRDRSTGLYSAGINMSFINSDTTSTGYESNYALDILSKKVTGTLTLKFINKLYYTVSLNYQQREGGYYKPGDSQETLFGDFIVTDMKLTCRLDQIDLFAVCNNVFNQPFIDIGNVQQPGQWFRAGLTVSIAAKSE